MEASDPRYAAVAGRDRRADGAFVYAVRTTGVFCRPSCAARTPKPANVAFYESPAEAARAGFRPCHRCRPDDPAGTAAEAAVGRARAHLDAALTADPTARVPLVDLARMAGVSPAHLQRTFTRLVGVSPRAYAAAHRLNGAKAALRAGETVVEATFDGGFGGAGALYGPAGAALGMTPGAYRRGGRGETVRFGLFETGLGALLVASTARGVCAVALGDDESALEGDLHAEFPAADVSRDDAAVAAAAAPIRRYLDGDGAAPLADLPLDLGGTAFQRRVWALLRTIPTGVTRTYGEVAATLGQPTATRAVAQACGANRAALVVPCHRVVGAKGELRGYRWGPERKRALIALEGRA